MTQRFRDPQTYFETLSRIRMLSSSETVIISRKNILFSIRSSLASHVSRISWRFGPVELCLIKKLSWLWRVLYIVGILVDRPHRVSLDCNFELQSHYEYSSQMCLALISLEMSSSYYVVVIIIIISVAYYCVFFIKTTEEGLANYAR